MKSHHILSLAILWFLPACGDDEQGLDGRASQTGPGTGEQTNTDNANEGEDANKDENNPEDDATPFGGAGPCEAPSHDLLYTHPVLAHGLAATDEYLYLAANDGLWRLDHDGRNPTQLYSKALSGVAALGERVYMLKDAALIELLPDGTTDVIGDASAMVKQADGLVAWPAFRANSEILHVDASGTVSKCSVDRNDDTRRVVTSAAVVDSTCYWTEMVSDSDDRHFASRAFNAPRSEVKETRNAPKTRNMTVNGGQLYLLANRPSQSLVVYNDLRTISLDGAPGKPLAGPLLGYKIITLGGTLYISDDKAFGCVYAWDSAASRLSAKIRGGSGADDLSLNGDYLYALTGQGRKVVRTRLE